MLALPIATLIFWGVAGLMALLQSERPSKIQYFLVWIILMLYLVRDLLKAM